MEIGDLVTMPCSWWRMFFVAVAISLLLFFSIFHSEFYVALEAGSDKPLGISHSTRFAVIFYFGIIVLDAFTCSIVRKNTDNNCIVEASQKIGLWIAAALLFIALVFAEIDKFLLMLSFVAISTWNKVFLVRHAFCVGKRDFKTREMRRRG